MAHRFGRIVGLGSAVILVLALAGPVAAAKPERAFAPADDIVVSGICAFDVLIETVVNKEYATTFFDQDGNVTRTQISGHLVQRVSRVGGDRAIVLNVSGPGRFVDTTEGLFVDTHGRWLLFIAGEMFVLSGHGQFLVNDSETIVSRRGNVLELCAILAG